MSGYGIWLASIRFHSIRFDSITLRKDSNALFLLLLLLLFCRTVIVIVISVINYSGCCWGVACSVKRSMKVIKFTIYFFCTRCSFRYHFLYRYIYIWYIYSKYIYYYKMQMLNSIEIELFLSRVANPFETLYKSQRRRRRRRDTTPRWTQGTSPLGTWHLAWIAAAVAVAGGDWRGASLTTGANTKTTRGDRETTADKRQARSERERQNRRQRLAKHD